MLAKLIWITWGQQVDVESNEVTIAYELLLALYQENLNSNLPWYGCNFSDESGRHMKFAIAGVVTYLLSSASR